MAHQLYLNKTSSLSGICDQKVLLGW